MVPVVETEQVGTELASQRPTGTVTWLAGSVRRTLAAARSGRALPPGQPVASSREPRPVLSSRASRTTPNKPRSNSTSCSRSYTPSMRYGSSASKMTPISVKFSASRTSRTRRPFRRARRAHQRRPCRRTSPRHALGTNDEGAGRHLAHADGHRACRRPRRKPGRAATARSRQESQLAAADACGARRAGTTRKRRRLLAPLVDAFMTGLGEKAEAVLSAYMDRAAAGFINLVTRAASIRCQAAVRRSCRTLRSRPYASRRREMEPDRMGKHKRGAPPMNTANRSTRRTGLTAARNAMSPTCSTTATTSSGGYGFRPEICPSCGRKAASTTLTSLPATETGSVG